MFRSECAREALPAAVTRERADTRTIVEWSPFVSEHAHRDSGSKGHNGKPCREVRWSVLPALGCTPLVITVEVERRLLHSPEVRVTSTGSSTSQEVLFPLTSGKSAGAVREQLREDFVYCWPFRMLSKGIGAAGTYEVEVTRGFGKQWLPATIKGQRADGLLDVVALLPDTTGCSSAQELRLPAVRAENIREKATGTSLQLTERLIVLTVPMKDPLAATLSVDGASEEANLSNLAWPFQGRGAGGAQGSRVSLRVSQDRQRICANVGHGELALFLSGEVRAKSVEALRERRSWTLQLGPWAQHTIALERRSRSGRAGKVVALSIDGMPFVEGSSKDLACSGGAWECNFRLVGERALDFEVYETTGDGRVLATQATVERKKGYSYNCSVRLAESSLNGALGMAELIVDGVSFNNLRPTRPPVEQHIDMASEAFQLGYGIAVPFHVRDEVAFYEDVAAAFHGFLPNGFAAVPAG